MLTHSTAIEAALAGTIFAGNLHFARITESTNSDAMAAARQGAPHGSVWVADEQTAGRGRGDHRWHSAAGEGLYVSVLLRPSFPAARLPLVPLVAGLAAAEAIGSVTGLAVDLRWPNDLLIGPRKTGGILIESQTGAKSLPHAVVVGIGINVHQRSFAPDLATAATSLDLETSTLVSRRQVLMALLGSLGQEVAALADTAAAEQVPARVEQHSSWVRGRRVEVHGPQACSGTTAGLDANGFLRVATAGGLMTVYTGGIRAAEEIPGR
jgi:BirA family biotin operon repressor/biotin-[acetyl-CoA-carboxylase] ligase